ncbi:glutamine synthetase [Pseudoclavibacter chungangensis]|uniref:Glutamine synthetase n=1 Tax=Pseudoclavibacter chungangensis TaxID=587635 RepID=A0A7J5BR79_9MICO|nr:glutamine synthetase family protein [Pseudoclavibacter chungangensis]KAB1656801.1 glutamine synthetase [Pseudoclavibacter chungangensis]NYJ67250.1 glutamine synthetase [Pseudoclavibacter chungangensis]
MSDGLVFIATSDLAARTKGRAVRAADFDERTSVGWVPADLGIGVDGHIVEGIPYGSSGDTRLRPDLSSRTRFAPVGERPGLDIVFADLVNTDGSPWESCPRTFLRDAIRDLREEFGITTRTAFEHEFVELGATTEPHAFSLQAFRDAEPVGSRLVALLADAGLEPETWLPEYGEHQYEITLAPTDALRAADRAILLRDVVRDVYDAGGRRATFAPVVRPGATGNGVHVHFGLDDADGNTLVYDAARPGRLSELAGSFAAGIVRHGPAMAALFAPLVTSYLRLQPHNWSTARSCLGLRNREALLRICPTNEIDGRDPARQLHFEFRGADIGANPWILLGSLLRAGLQGLREKLETPEIVTGEIDVDGTHAHLAALPGSLGEALDALRADEVVSGWFHPNTLATFEAVKRVEITRLDPMTPEERCDAYTSVY